jgi:hypothetical protein
MNEPSKNKLLSLLVEIQSDIRQIKSDLQSLLTFLKEQQKPTPVPPPDGDHAPDATEGSPSTSPEEIVRYLRELRGEDDVGD